MDIITVSFETDTASEAAKDQLMANLVDRIRYVIAEEFGSDEVMGYEGPFITKLFVEGDGEVATWKPGDTLNY